MKPHTTSRAAFLGLAVAQTACTSPAAMPPPLPEGWLATGCTHMD
jgi:hypothetical protein